MCSCWTEAVLGPDHLRSPAAKHFFFCSSLCLVHLCCVPFEATHQVVSVSEAECHAPILHHSPPKPSLTPTTPYPALHISSTPIGCLDASWLNLCWAVPRRETLQASRVCGLQDSQSAPQTFRRVGLELVWGFRNHRNRTLLYDKPVTHE